MIDLNTRVYLAVISGIYAIAASVYLKSQIPNSLLLIALLGLIAALLSVTWEKKNDALFIQLKAMERITLRNSKAFQQLILFENEVAEQFITEKKFKIATSSTRFWDSMLPFLFRCLSIAVFTLLMVVYIARSLKVLINY